MSSAPRLFTSPPRRPYRPLQGFGAAFAWGLRLALGRPRRLLIFILVGGLVGFLVGTQGIARSGSSALRQSQAAFDLWEALDLGLLPYVVPLVALTLVAGGFQREVADRTLVFHLVRPISRQTLYLARFLAGVVVAVPLAVVPLGSALAFSGLSLPAGVYAGLAATASLGVLSSGAIYYLLAAILKHGTIAGLVYTFVIDSFVQASAGSLQRLSALYYVRSVHHGLSDGAFAELSERVRSQLDADGGLDLSRGVTRALLEARRIDWLPPAEAALVLLALTALLVLVGMRVVARKDFAVKE